MFLIFSFHVFALFTAVNCLTIGATFALSLVKNYPPTPRELVANVQIDPINKLFSVPIFLEQLVHQLESQKPVTYRSLARLQFIIYGGAALSDEICRKLTDQGVHLVSCYGTTETVNKHHYSHLLIIII